MVLFIEVIIHCPFVGGLTVFVEDKNAVEIFIWKS